MCKAPDLHFPTDDERRPASELWLVHGKYYDLRPFYKHHPGGQWVLQQCMGSDCTSLVYSHHLTDKPFQVLKKYASPPASHATEMRKEYGRDTAIDYSYAPDGFYMTVRSRVAQSLKEQGMLSQCTFPVNSLMQTTL